jgi:hypothetical protein
MTAPISSKPHNLQPVIPNIKYFLVLPPLSQIQKIPAPKKVRVKLSQALPIDTRVGHRYISHMDNLPLNHTKWNDRLAFDVALTLEGSGETLQEIMGRHNISASDMLMFKADPVFLKKVEMYRDEVKEKGITFKLKARAQAEELLTTSWLLIHSPDVSPAVKADLIKSTVKWAGLEPKNDVTTEGGTGGVRIMINLGNNPSDARTIEASTIEASDATTIEYSESVQ